MLIDYHGARYLKAALEIPRSPSIEEMTQ